MTKRDSVRIDLTNEQQQQIKDAFGTEISSLELDVRELEQRIAPSELTIIKVDDKATANLFKQ